MLSIILRRHSVVPVLNSLTGHQVIVLHVLTESPVSTRDYEHSQLRKGPPLRLDLSLFVLVALGNGDVVDDGLDAADFEAVVLQMQPCTVVAEEDTMVQGHENSVELFLFDGLIIAHHF